MNKHTPGPWEVGYCTWNDDGNVCYELRGIKKGCASDARLISAAPDMLDALRAAEDSVGDFKTMEIVRAAIAKATGEK